MNHLLISHSLQNVKLENENVKLKNELRLLNLEKDNLDEENKFYKSLFKTHGNSAVYNLYIKLKNGKRVWVDPTRQNNNELSQLDEDDEVSEWLMPVKVSS